MELYLLKFFFVGKNFQQFGAVLEPKFLKDNAPELHAIYQAVESWHTKFPDRNIASVEEFSVFFFTMFPDRDSDITHTIFQKMAQIEPNDAVARDYLLAVKRRTMATKASLLALEVAQGRQEYSALAGAWEALQEASDEPSEEFEFIEPDDTDGRPPQGLRWRLNCLNKSLGSLRQGDNGFAFARPEAGKTTWGLDQGTYMTEQLVAKQQGPCLYANNEQPGDVMMERAIQALLGIDQETYFKYKRQANAKFKSKLNGQFLLFDKAHMTAREVERIVQRYEPGLIIIDQLDNIKGFSDKKDREDLSLKALYQWARELAKDYCPVIGLTQCGGTGEGKKWLTMDDVDGSKTGKQSAADWILGIGKSNQEGLENIRHFSIAKNKLRGDEDSDRTKRHGKFDVRLLPEICRFEDV